MDLFIMIDASTQNPPYFDKREMRIKSDSRAGPSLFLISESLNSGIHCDKVFLFKKRIS